MSEHAPLPAVTVTHKADLYMQVLVQWGKQAKRRRVCHSPASIEAMRARARVLKGLKRNEAWAHEAALDLTQR